MQGRQVAVHEYCIALLCITHLVLLGLSWLQIPDPPPNPVQAAGCPLLLEQVLRRGWKCCVSGRVRAHLWKRRQVNCPQPGSSTLSKGRIAGVYFLVLKGGAGGDASVGGHEQVAGWVTGYVISRCTVLGSFGYKYFCLRWV